MSVRQLFLFILMFTLVGASFSDMFGASARALIREGNKKCAAEQYDEALNAYEEAGVDIPESPHLYFNKGVAYYGKGDYDKAVEAFEKAALKSKDLELEAKAKFNLGNCAFRQSERQRDSDLQKSLEECKKSILHYQEALKLKPDYNEAAENIEVVRLIMKSILDEIKKQQEAAQEQQKNQQEIVNKLKELIVKQQAAADETQALHEDRMANGDSPETNEKIKDLASNQEGIKQSTEALAQELAATQPPQASTPQPTQPQTPSPLEPVKEHVDTAIVAQSRSLENLGQSDTEMAHQNQENAVEALKKALDALTNQDGEGQQQQNQQQGEQEQQNTESQQSSGGQEEEEKEQEQQAMSALTDEAKDILDEEKENQKRRQLSIPGGYQPVDRDW